MASLSRFVLFFVLLHIVSETAAQDGLRVQRSIADASAQVATDVLVDIQTRLIALEQTVTQQNYSLESIKSMLTECGLNDPERIASKRDISITINQGRFTIAEEKLLKLNDTAMVAEIVRDMCAISNHHFGMLVNMSKRVNNISLQSQILTILYHKAKESDDISTRNLIELAKCLKGCQQDRVIGIGSFKKQLEKIAENTIATFVDVLKWRDDYPTNSEVRALAAAIAEWRDVSETVMTGLVSRVFRAVDSNKILEAVSNHTDAWQALVGVHILIQNLQFSGSFTDSIALDIASRIAQIVNVDNLDSTVQNYANRVKRKIPLCIMNLFSSTDFCIRNKYQGSFLIHSTSHYDDRQLNILTEPPSENGTTPSGAKWRLKRNEGKLFFGSVTHPNSFFYASDLSFQEFGRVMIVNNSGDFDEKSAWLIETFGDSCYLKSVAKKNEYLFASDLVLQDTEFKFAGLNPKDYNSGSKFRWQIVTNC